MLDDVDLAIEEGEFVCLIGPSGCGKTVTLNLIAGFEQPTRGSVRYRGREVAGPGPERGVVFQEYSLLPWLTVLENVVFALDSCGAPRATRRDTALSALRAVGFAEFADQRPNLLSGGMKQRVAIARLLAMDSDVFLMDEPFSALDGRRAPPSTRACSICGASAARPWCSSPITSRRRCCWHRASCCTPARRDPSSGNGAFPKTCRAMRAAPRPGGSMPRSGTSCPRARARLRRMRDAHMSGKGGRTAARRKKEREAIMRTRKRTAKAKVLLLACMAALTLGVAGLWGCASGDGQGDAKQGENTASESQEALEPVSVAYLNKAGYETVIVADKKGYFDVAPMDVELLTVSGSGQQSVEALLAGSADIAATGQGPVADALGQYGDDIVVLCGTNCNTNSQVIVAAPSMAGDTAITPYDKASDNKAEVKASFEAAAAALGRPVKLGVQQGATTESAVKSWMSAMGVSVNDFGTEGDGTVTLVDVKANTLPTVLAAGSDIDLMAASQPYPDTALSAAPGSYRVGSNADTNSYDVAAYITTKEVYEKKEASLKEFVKALDQATDYMADSANEAECVKICADSMGASEDTVRAAFSVADWKTGMTDTMLDSLAKAVKKKGYEMTPDQIKAACPLIPWMDAELGD